MKTKTHNFVFGIGSVMDLAPVRDLRAFGRRQTAAERMAAHFINVGQSIAAASHAYQADTDAATAKTKNA